MQSYGGASDEAEGGSKPSVKQLVIATFEACGINIEPYIISHVKDDSSTTGNEESTTNEEMLSLLEKSLDIHHPLIVPSGEGSGTTTSDPSTKLSMSYHHSNDIPSLDEKAPFSPLFYTQVGKLLSFVYNNPIQKVPSSMNTLQSPSSHHLGSARESQMKSNRASKQKGHDRDLESFSLFKNIDSVRMTKIFITLMEMNANEVARNKYKAIPIMNSIFRHVSLLPQLESLVYKMIRDFRNATTSASKSDGGGIDTQMRVQGMKVVQMYQERLERELKDHLASLEYILGEIYEQSNTKLRQMMRLRLGSTFHTFSLSSGSGNGIRGMASMGIENTTAAGMDSLLRVLLRILRGIKSTNSTHPSSSDNYGNDLASKDTPTLPESYRHLLFQVLLPLHKPSGMVLWRDQISLLALYHKPLVQCMGAIISLDISLVGKTIDGLLHPDIWPLERKSAQSATSAGEISNTPKVLLLLHEIDTFIELLPLKSSSDQKEMIDGKDGIAQDTTYHLKECILPLVLRLSNCIASSNSRTAERALQFFKNQKFQQLIRYHLPQVVTPLLRALCRIDSGMEVPWNPTVRKMTLIVIRELESYDKVLFEESCKSLTHRNTYKGSAQEAKDDVKECERSNGSVVVGDDAAPNSLLTQATMKQLNGWRPSKSPRLPKPIGSTNATSSSSRLGTGAQPPLGVTGVAPWAVSGNSQASSNLPKKSSNPPLGVTGVAPWAVKSGTSQGLSKKPFRPYEKEDGSESSLARIHEFIEKLKPTSMDHDDSNSDGVSSWAKAQMAETPTLLTNLKFHDLVFGQTLGTGAFSTVKYARQIKRNQTRSYWPEFACKIVSTSKIEELGYEQSINREITILKMLSHPSIARLVSSFRFRDGAYLVLEYASGGDLHTLLKRNGSLDEKSTRFVIGEVVAALSSIHDIGFLYGDLKPENILVTESGHIKLTDFGGCRPATDDAKSMLKQQMIKNTIQSLRNGDWRESSSTTSETEALETAEYIEDDRIEGTTCYLPPEVVLGTFPTRAADSWALGCTLFQCLAGRPPILEDDEASTRHRIVSFELPSSHESDFINGEFFLENKGIQAFSEKAKNLTKRLLNRIPSERPSMTTIAADSFFEGIDVFTLYKTESHRLDVGTVAPTTDSKWSRRQFSSIWAPQPEEYSINSGNAISSKIVAPQDAPILEGAERDGAFLKTARTLTKVIER